MATKSDWYNTFLANKTGRKVMFELRQKLYNRFRQEDQPISPETALAQCILDDTAMWISEKCGIDTEEAEMQMIDYEAATAAASMLGAAKEEEQEAPDLLETH